ncbi:MAG: class II glutamine amidotransferase, partial [Fervidicoccaceae archaeon]
MCGIVGYIGNKNANEIVYQGIKRLEYRGYDSVGICYKKGNTLVVKKDIGKIEEVASKLNFLEEDSNLAIAHTRWGTHGKITKENAHPHLDCSKNIAIVHNGIIENFYELKEDLIKRGHKFNSETDSEVIAHLIEEYMKFYDFENSCKKAFSKLKGSFAVLAINSKEEKIVGIR